MTIQPQSIVAMKIKINYKYNNIGTLTLLGTEEFVGISENVFPNPSSGSHSITITKFFDGQSCHRWKIITVTQTLTQSHLEIEAIIEPRSDTTNEVFLFKTLNAHKSAIHRIRKGVFVEVDFGFIQSVFKKNGSIKSVKRYPDVIQMGEMHKRRLAIVVGTNRNKVTVLPITSVPQDLGDKTIFELEPKSTHLLRHYNGAGVNAFAICSMIQTVSTTRILPPLSIHQKTEYRDTNYPNKLTSADYKKFEKALAASIGIGDYFDLKNEKEEKKNEILSLETINSDLKQQVDLLQDLKSKHGALMEMMIDMKRGLHNYSVETAAQEIEKDIKSYLEILSG